MTDTNFWQISHASHIGKSHLDNNINNQDRIFTAKQQGFFVAVVCDGAGSAKHSEIGASYFSQKIGELLSHFSKQILTKNQQNPQIFEQNLAETYHKFLLKNIASVRENLPKAINDEQHFHFDDYHCTLTAILVFDNADFNQQNYTINKALILKIGDSPLFFSQFLANPTDKTIDYFTNLQLIDEQKSEYVNETHFITQQNWQQMLDIYWLDVSNVDCIAVMSDGCGDLCLQAVQQSSQQKSVYRPFLANLLFNLLHQPNDSHNHIINNALANPATYRLTGDDKSLVLLIKNPNDYQNFEPLTNETIDETLDEMSDKNFDNNGLTESNLTNKNPVPLPPPQQNPTNNNALPQAQNLSKTGKNRLLISLLSVFFVMAGVGVLAWFNQQKIMDFTAKIQGKTDTQTQNPPITTAIPTPSPIIQGFDTHTPLTIVQASNTPFFIHSLVVFNDGGINTITPNFSKKFDNISIKINNLKTNQQQEAFVHLYQYCQTIDNSWQQNPLLKTWFDSLTNQQNLFKNTLYCKITFNFENANIDKTNVFHHETVVQLPQGLDFMVTDMLKNKQMLDNKTHDPSQGQFIENKNMSTNAKVYFLPPNFYKLDKINKMNKIDKNHHEISQ